MLVALVLQPLSGALAHHLFAASRSKTIVHVIHRWLGRGFLVLGAINGGLGLRLQQLYGKRVEYMLIPYVVVVVVVFVAWGVVLGWDARTKRGKETAKLESGSETEVVEKTVTLESASGTEVERTVVGAKEEGEV